MSMIFSMVGVTPQQERMLRNDESLAGDLAMVMEGDGGALGPPAFLNDLPEERRREAEAEFRKTAMATKFEALSEEIVEARERLSAFGAIERPLGLEKSWHILHYTFTGEAGPVRSAAGALLAGDEVGEDIGYGPPRLHSPESTQAFAAFLDRLTVEDLRARLRYSAMLEARIYGLPMGRGGEAAFEDGIRREVSSYFPRLRDYVVQTADRKSGLLMWLT